MCSLISLQQGVKMTAGEKHWDGTGSREDVNKMRIHHIMLMAMPIPSIQWYAKNPITVLSNVSVIFRSKWTKIMDHSVFKREVPVP